MESSLPYLTRLFEDLATQTAAANDEAYTQGMAAAFRLAADAVRREQVAADAVARIIKS